MKEILTYNKRTFAKGNNATEVTVIKCVLILKCDKVLLITRIALKTHTFICLKDIIFCTRPSDCIFLFISGHYLQIFQYVKSLKNKFMVQAYISPFFSIIKLPVPF